MDGYADPAYAILTILLPMILMILLYLGIGVVTGLVARTLAQKKGYEGYFWTGFLLSTIGIIYVAGLPDKRAEADHLAILQRLADMQSKVTHLESHLHEG
jgi:hypothetical protein